jgi:hypothetical protein
MVTVVSTMEAREKKTLQLVSGEGWSAEFLEKFFSSRHVVIQKRSFEARLSENLAHDGGKRIHKVVLHIETSRAEGPSFLRAGLETNPTVDPSEGRAASVLVLNGQVPIFVGVISHTLKDPHVVVRGTE